MMTSRIGDKKRDDDSSKEEQKQQNSQTVQHTQTASGTAATRITNNSTLI